LSDVCSSVGKGDEFRVRCFRLVGMPGRRRRALCPPIKKPRMNPPRDEDDEDDEERKPHRRTAKDEDDDSDDDDDLLGSDDKEDLGEDPLERRAVQAKVDEAVKEIESGRRTFLLLGDLKCADVALTKKNPALVTAKAVLESPHILVERGVGTTCVILLKRLRALGNQSGSGTTIGNNLFDFELIPGMKRVQAAIKSSMWQDALGMLLAMSMFTREDNMYLYYNELWLEKAKFKGYINGYSTAWKALLARSNADLGLDGCRPHLIEMLSSFQEEMKRVLEDVYAEFNFKLDFGLSGASN